MYSQDQRRCPHYQGNGDIDEEAFIKNSNDDGNEDFDNIEWEE